VLGGLGWSRLLLALELPANGKETALPDQVSSRRLSRRPPFLFGGPGEEFRDASNAGQAPDASGADVSGQGQGFDSDLGSESNLGRVPMPGSAWEPRRTSEVNPGAKFAEDPGR
jgi:hypothetical protein